MWLRNVGTPPPNPPPGRTITAQGGAAPGGGQQTKRQASNNETISKDYNRVKSSIGGYIIGLHGQESGGAGYKSRNTLPESRDICIANKNQQTP